MFTLILSLLIFFSLVYFIKIVSFYFGLSKIKAGENNELPPVTILIPARNEEQNISSCLNSVVNQNYPREKMQIIVIDDNSQDRTAEIVRGYFEKFPFIQLISLSACPPGISPKKRALQAGIEAADNEIIFTLDADCQASPDWLQSMVRYFEENVGMVAGFVALDESKEKSLFHKLQTLEFLGLTTAGMGSIGNDDPVIANGANLAFRKSAFYDAGGYDSEKYIVSGDDDLLMQKMHRFTDWKIRANIEKQAIVKTAPANSLKEFINQRIRWASKGLIYRKLSLVVFLLSVYFYFLLLFVSVPFALMFPTHFPYPLFALFIKIFADFFVIFKGTALLDRKDLRKYFLLAEIFHIPYILYVGFAGVLGTFEWKGR